ncbi:unnamed protein product [Angiostrongylus costaricensis]|uniref:ENTH domain-containing protein n=1 Tax=Angiostrongylus costaricensis TaxID=334426 RepID=A0A0R3Q0C1_ANGCS|nr:unnamed protein product [Angiostrongylus costaricensis]
MSDFLSGISNLTKQISSNIPYQIKKLGESVHTMVMNYTEAENIVYEATNEDPWGPTGPQMKEIANCTFQYDGFNQVTNLLWKRMLEDNKTAWRRVYKVVLFDSSADHFASLDRFRSRFGFNSLSVLCFNPVRHRVKTILELLGDDDKLRAQRKKVKSDNKDRYQGYTSEDIRMGRAAPYDDYSSKEVNSFQFPDETRRGSVSPELGFRQDVS